MTIPYFDSIDGVLVVEITRASQLLEFCQMTENDFIFRGHGSSDWKLEPRLERDIDIKARKHISLSVVECEILSRFKRRAHHYLRSAEVPESDLEWLALIQHYGGPTRLLDFTTSIYIAAYFALVGRRHHKVSAIWAVNHRAISQHFYKIQEVETAKFQRVATQYGLHYKDQHVEQWFTAIMKGQLELRAVFAAEPFRQNRRLLSQQGLFLFQTDLSVSFIENLINVFASCAELQDEEYGRLRMSLDTDGQAIQFEDLIHPPEDNWWSGNISNLGIVKLIIRRENQISIREDLRRMNILTESLFPDLDGEARSLLEVVTDLVDWQRHNDFGF